MAGRAPAASASTTEHQNSSDAQGAPKAGLELSDSERRAVREELNRLLASKLFHFSHRCKTLLRYVVEESLSGNAESLKERLIGISVFHRVASYDTNSDPVVRMAAGELRKKLAQYYYDPANQTTIRIELPTGAYSPMFRLADPHLPTIEDSANIYPEAIETESEYPAPLASPAANEPHPFRQRILWWGLAMAVVIASALLLQRINWRTQDAFEAFWAPVMKSSNPVLLCMGQMRATGVELDPNPSINPFGSPMRIGPNGEYPREMPVAVLADAETLVNIAGLLNGKNKAYITRGEGSTTFSDLQKGPVVLLGAFNNDWTMRVTKSMRFHFAMNEKTLVWWIEDRQHPGVKIGETSVTSLHLTDDYAVVARVLDPQTLQPTIVVAGVTPLATHAAGEFLTNPLYLNEIARSAPHDWNARNMEFLIKTNIVDGDPGPPQVMAAYYW